MYLANSQKSNVYLRHSKGTAEKDEDCDPDWYSVGRFPANVSTMHYRIGLGGQTDMHANADDPSTTGVCIPYMQL